MKVLYKALDGREFVISADSMEEAQETINDIRKALGLEQPDFQVVEGDTKVVPELKEYTKLEELSEELQEAIKQSIEDAKEVPDIKDMN